MEIVRGVFKESEWIYSGKGNLVQANMFMFFKANSPDWFSRVFQLTANKGSIAIFSQYSYFPAYYCSKIANTYVPQMVFLFSRRFFSR